MGRDARCIAWRMPRQRHQCLGLGLIRRAGIRSGPGMAKDVARLEVRAIGRFLEHQIFRKVLGIVSDMKPREKYVLALRKHPFPAAPLRFLPKYAQTAQLFRRQRVGGTGVAPVHVPGILQEQTSFMLALHLLAEEVPIEVAKPILDVERYFLSLGDAHDPVVRRLYPS